jgi:hypothetical protein
MDSLKKEELLKRKRESHQRKKIVNIIRRMIIPLRVANGKQE